MTQRPRPKRGTKAWYGPLAYDWRPAPFGRIRKVPAAEVRRWAGSAERHQAEPVTTWRDLAPQLAAWDAERVTIAEQAERLGLRHSQLTGIRARLRREGRLVARQPGKGRDWPKADEDRLIELLEQGHGYDELARRFKRTRVAIILKCRRLGIRVTTSLATLSARDVAKLVGKKCSKSVVYWIEQGWLPARNAGGAGHHALWRGQWDDLTAFLEQREHWMAWDAEAVTDLPLREWAQELRAAAGGRWLSIGEVARRYCVDSRAVNQWIRRGWLSATRYGNWWVWSADLEGWVAPCERPRAGIPKGTGRRLEGGSGVVAAEGGRFCLSDGCRRRAFYREFCQACRAEARQLGVRIDDLGADWRQAAERKRAA